MKSGTITTYITLSRWRLYRPIEILSSGAKHIVYPKDINRAQKMALALPQAIIATNIILLALAICSVVLRFVVRKQNPVPLGPDDYLIAVALVSNEMKSISTTSLISDEQLSSLLLVITNIIGVCVGGFGTLVSLWAAEDTAKFLKVFLHVELGSDSVYRTT